MAMDTKFRDPIRSLVEELAWIPMNPTAPNISP